MIHYYGTYLMSWLTTVSFSPGMVIVFYCHLSDVSYSSLTCKTGKVSYKAFLRRNELRACIARLLQTLSGFNLQWGVKSLLSGICHGLGCGSVRCSRDVECESCVSLGSIGGHCHLLSPLPEMTVWLSTLERSFLSCCHIFFFFFSFLFSVFWIYYLRISPKCGGIPFEVHAVERTWSWDSERRASVSTTWHIGRP